MRRIVSVAVASLFLAASSASLMRIAIALLVASTLSQFVLAAQNNPTPATIFVQPTDDGFQTYIVAAIVKKGVPVNVVDREDLATLALSAARVEVHQESTGSKVLKCLFAYCADIADNASTSVQLVDREGHIVWSYAVNKGRGAKNRQSMAEAISVSLKERVLPSVRKRLHASASRRLGESRIAVVNALMSRKTRMDMRRSALLIGLFAAVSCGSESPATPTILPANLASQGNLTVQSCTASTPPLFNCFSYTGSMRNNGSGCAGNVRGVTKTFATSTQNQVGTSSWSYTPRVRPSEEIVYAGLNLVVPGPLTGGWFYTTTASWDNVSCQ